MQFLSSRLLLASLLLKWLRSTQLLQQHLTSSHTLVFSSQRSLSSQKWVAVAQEMAAALSGAKSVEEALAAAQAAADAIMHEAGYY